MSIRGSWVPTNLHKIDISLLFRFMWLCFLLVLGCSWSTCVCAQSIRIKLENGKNGRPIANKCIDVWVGDKSMPKSRPLLQTQTDDDGIASLRLTTEDSHTNTQVQQLSCGLAGFIDPLVKYGDTIGVRSGYVVCQGHRGDYSWLAILDFSTKEVLQSGIVTSNMCGKVKASPEPGEIVLFVRPLTFWEKLKE